mmetsp:Transcript_12631/g.36287  ORF Transcript_12631/g.36287 Transcript_12631/m.36287 type:complete len:113 (+) Transcript_12631:98-436(+)
MPPRLLGGLQLSPQTLELVCASRGRSSLSRDVLRKDRIVDASRAVDASRVVDATRLVTLGPPCARGGSASPPVSRTSVPPAASIVRDTTGIVRDGCCNIISLNVICFQALHS